MVKNPVRLIQLRSLKFSTVRRPRIRHARPSHIHKYIYIYAYTYADSSGNPDRFSPLALRAMKVCACLLTITGSQVRGTGSLLRMCIRKSPGVTADNSHFSFETTSCSHLCNNHPDGNKVQTIVSSDYLSCYVGFSSLGNNV